MPPRRQMEVRMNVKYRKLSPDAVCPVYATEYSAGVDLCAVTDGEVTVGPGETAMIRTGLAVELECGTVGLVCARSGMASKRGLAPANKVGVIDCDYRGEIIVALHNHGREPQTVRPGERIAQLVIVPYIKVCFEEASELSDTVRGEGGFGSTGR